MRARFLELALALKMTKLKSSSIRIQENLLKRFKQNCEEHEIIIQVFSYIKFVMQ